MTEGTVMANAHTKEQENARQQLIDAGKAWREAAAFASCHAAPESALLLIMITKRARCAGCSVVVVTAGLGTFRR